MAQCPVASSCSSCRTLRALARLPEEKAETLSSRDPEAFAPLRSLNKDRNSFILSMGTAIEVRFGHDGMGWVEGCPPLCPLQSPPCNHGLTALEDSGERRCELGLAEPSG